MSLIEIDEVMSAYIKPQTSPLAIKMLEGAEEIPKTAKSPVRDFGVPGNGDRRLGLVVDGELAFGMPRKRFEEVIHGLKLSQEGKQTYPISPGYLKLEYTLPPSYGALRKALFESSK